MRRRDRSALGILFALWGGLVIVGLAHWLTREPDFALRRPVGIVLHAPPLPWPENPPRGARWSGDRFPLATILDAPRKRGTYAELETAGFGIDGPRTILEITSRPVLFMGGVGGALRVLPVEYPKVRPGVYDESRVDPTRSRKGRIVLADGCLRIDGARGPLVVVHHDTAGAYRDGDGWLTIGRIGNGNMALRAGEPGEISFAPPMAAPAAIAALRTRCGGGPVVTVHRLRRQPICDMTRAEEIAAWRKQQGEYAALRAASEADRAQRVTACRAQGQPEAYCERTVMQVPMPPMPPPAIPRPDVPPSAPGDPPPPRTDCDYPS